MNVLPPNLRFGAHQSVTRLGDDRLLRGRALHRRPGGRRRALDGAAALAARPCAIAGVDVAPARAMPGVVAVYTGADLVAANVNPLPARRPMFKRPDGADMTVPPRRLLAHEVARFVGEPVAAVIAASREAAYDALEAIAIEYEELPAVTDVREAAKPGAPRVWPDAADNFVAAHAYGDGPAVDAIFGRRRMSCRSTS